LLSRFEFQLSLLGKLTVVAKLLLLEYKLGMEASSNIPVEGVESGEERAEGREGQARREEVMAGAVDPPAGIDMMTWQKLAEGLWFGDEEIMPICVSLMNVSFRRVGLDSNESA